MSKIFNAKNIEFKDTAYVISSRLRKYFLSDTLDFNLYCRIMFLMKIAERDSSSAWVTVRMWLLKSFRNFAYDIKRNE